MTFDGWIILVTDEGALVALSRDFSEVRTIMINESEDAPAHNEMVAEAGLRGFNWIRNPMAIRPSRRTLAPGTPSPFGSTTGSMRMPARA